MQRFLFGAAAFAAVFCFSPGYCQPFCGPRDKIVGWLA